MKLFYSVLLCGLLAFLMFNPTVGFGQNAKIDSLMNELSKAQEDTNKVKIFINLNLVLMEAREMDKLLENANKLLALSQKLKFPEGIMQGYNGIGAFHFEMGKYEETSKYYLKALQIAEQQKDLAGIGQLYNNLAGVYMVSNDKEQAAKYFEKSYNIYKKLGKEVNVMIASYNLGHIYTIIGKYDIALNYLQESLILANKFNHGQGRIMILNATGVLYEKQGNYTKEVEIYKEALAQANKTQDDYHSTHVLNNIGYAMYKFLNKYDSAEYFVKKSVELSKKINHKEALKNSYAYLSDIYKEKKNYDEAFKYVDLLAAIKDSLLNEKKVEAMAELEKKYETEKKEAQLKISEQERIIAKADADRNFWGIVIACFFMLVAIGFVLLFRKISIANQKLRGIADHKTINDYVGLLGGFKADNGLYLPHYQEAAGKMLAAIATSRMLAQSTQANDYIGMNSSEVEKFMQMKTEVMNTKNVSIKADIANFALPSKQAKYSLFLIDELLTNAIKHAFAGIPQPEVSLSLQQENGGLHLVFRDNGNGIPEGKKPKVIHELVESFNGTIQTSNENGTVHDIFLKANLKK